MKLSDFKNLIHVLHVKYQSETIIRRKHEGKLTWIEDAEKFYKTNKDSNNLCELNDKIFKSEEAITISRQDIFDTKNTEELILKVLYWGYPYGMRGKHFDKILCDFSKLKKNMEELILAKDILNTNRSLEDYIENIENITGLGLSTFSKLLYFFEIKYDNYPCLIFDDKIIKVINNKHFEEYSNFNKINDYNKTSTYLSYLQTTNNISKELKTIGENIEFFLFAFGNNLKY